MKLSPPSETNSSPLVKSYQWIIVNGNVYDNDLRYHEGTEGGQMSDDNDISNFLSRPRQLLSDICVQFITPGNVPPVPSGNFSMDAGFGNQTSVDDSEQKRPRLRLAWTDSRYLLENNDSSPHSRFFQRSVKNTNTPNQYKIQL